MRGLILVSSLLALLACNRKSVQPESSGERAAGTPVSSEEAGRKLIDSLETQARAAAKADGCNSSADCRAAPIGVRGCGGPRDFIVYCAAATDSAELYRRIAVADSAEAAYNKEHSVISTCELRMPPAVEARNGSCMANR